MFPQLPPPQSAFSSAQNRQTCAKASTDFSVWCRNFLAKIPSQATCFVSQSPPRSRQGPLLLGARRSGHLVQATSEAGTFQKLDPAASVDHKSGQAGSRTQPNGPVFAPWAAST